MHRKLFISMIPTGTPETASSRIRVYQLIRSLHLIGIRCTLGPSIRANVLFVQKTASLEVVIYSFVFRLFGRKVIFDIDDLGKALSTTIPEKRLKLMLFIATHITTCSEKQAEFISKKYKTDKVSYFPNSIDYFPKHPIRYHRATSHGPLRVIWFGNTVNFKMFEKYVYSILNIKNIQLVAVVGQRDVDILSAKYPQIEFHDWNLCTFLGILMSCDISCLMHDGLEEDTAKGNNRMTTSICYGVSVLVSRTHSYEKTAKELGIEDALFTDQNDLIQSIEKMKSYEIRKKQLKAAQKLCWEKYSPDTVASIFLSILNPPS